MRQCISSATVTSRAAMLRRLAVRASGTAVVDMTQVPSAVSTQIFAFAHCDHMFLGSSIVPVSAAKSVARRAPNTAKASQPAPRILYEVLSVRDNVPMFMDQHLDRLLGGLSLHGVQDVVAAATIQTVRDAIHSVVQQNEGYVGGVNVQVMVWWRGADDPSGSPPGVAVFLLEAEEVDPTMAAQGCHMKYLDIVRDNPDVKEWNAEQRAKIIEQMRSDNADEYLLVRDNKFVTEGFRSNFFIVTASNAVWTPPDAAVLQGVTRENVIECCKDLGLTVERTMITKEEAEQSAAAFITSTKIGVLPVASLNGHAFPSAQHPVVKSVRTQFEHMVSGTPSLGSLIV